MRLSFLQCAGLLLALGAAFSSSTVEAGSDALAKAPDFDALLARIGSPLDPVVVGSLSRHPEVGDPAKAERLLGTLWHAGGHVAARGLLTLTAHEDAGIRATALRGIAHVGIRLAGSLEGVRKALDDRDLAVRLAAYQALGRVGDAADMPVLLKALESEDKHVAQAGYRALAVLTGQRMLCCSGRWIAWWTEAKEEMPARISAALETLEAGGEVVDLEDARRLVAQNGWMELETIETALRLWLRSPDARVRIEGYALAAALRLGDLASDVDTAFRYDGDKDARREGLATCVLLGTAKAVVDVAARPLEATGSR